MSGVPPPANLPARKYASQLARHFFPGKKIHIHQLAGGITNFVYSVQAGKEEFVIRISSEPEKFDLFLKQQWAVSKAREKKIPVAEIFEVGNSIIPLPYMIVEKMEGIIAAGHPERKEILFELGKLGAAIHTISTKGYGHQFAWSENELSVLMSWEEFLDKDLDLKKRLRVLKSNKMITSASYKNMLGILKEMYSWRGRGSLQHGDLRLKNVMVTPKGKIKAIIDWDDCISAIGPAWDLSIALHDLPVEGQQRFLDGYGMSPRKLINMKDHLSVFNLLNYAPVIERLKMERNAEALSWYRARLHGALDLFSL